MPSKFKPVKTEDLVEDKISYVMAAHNGTRTIEAVVNFFIIGPACVLYETKSGKDTLYRGRSLEKAVHVYNGGILPPEQCNEAESDIQEQPTHVKLEIQARRKHKLL